MEIYGDSGRTFIADVFAENGDAKVNARLIAAAPDLLKACQNLTDCLVWWSAEAGMSIFGNIAVDEDRARLYDKDTQKALSFADRLLNRLGAG